MSCGVGHRRGSDPELLWLWHRLTATAPIRPLAWEPSIYHRSGPRNGKKTKKKKKKKRKKERKKENLSSAPAFFVYELRSFTELVLFT